MTNFVVMKMSPVHAPHLRKREKRDDIAKLRRRPGWPCTEDDTHHLHPAKYLPTSDVVIGVCPCLIPFD
jgi:hypothetical protein